MDKPFNILNITKKPCVAQRHEHDFEELIIGVDGEVEYFMDHKISNFVAPYICFNSKGTIHSGQSVSKDGKCNVWILNFKNEFIPETAVQSYSYYHYYHDLSNLKIPKGKSFDRMIALCEMMMTENQQAAPRYEIIHHLLNALLVIIESEIKQWQPHELHFQISQNGPFQTFLKILEENFRQQSSVEFYAGKLFMSARNLNLLCKNIFNKTASDIIETRKLVEAKSLLLNSPMTISEIGFELGYNEKAYFSTVFKKKAGQTPSEYRNNKNKLTS